MRKILLFFLVLLATSTPIPAQTYKVLYYSQLGGANFPAGTITQSRGGAMFASTQYGQVFRITTNGCFKILHRFDTAETDYGFSGLTLATDGQFYGTTMQSGGLWVGRHRMGTIFRISQDGTVTTLHKFTGGSDGSYPTATPIQSVAGDFYGTGGASVYSITKNGNFTLLHPFPAGSVFAPLVQGTDFYFYGISKGDGQYGHGTIFRIGSSGDFKVLVNFNGANGSNPPFCPCFDPGLIQANDGNFYGVTRAGGSLGYGILFRMKPGGAMTVLHNFTGGSDGANPAAALVQASDGNLYGTNVAGGKNGYGVLFRASLNGDIVPLHDFDFATGTYPSTPLLQHTNGILYGATDDGAPPVNAGVFYSFDAGLPRFVTYLPTYGRAGALVQILGQDFTAGSQVSFNGKLAASPVVVYPTYLRVVVPSGATTGPITVTTANGTLTSNKVFIVHPY